jgi:hypothetical protein
MAASLCPLTRDDPGYWRRRPADHGPDGLYRDGPHQARPALLIGAAPSRTQRERDQARYEQEQARIRGARRRALPAPRLAPSEHPRRCKKAVRCMGRAAR